MKKIFSAILALAMSMSLFTFTAQAGTDGYYELSYEAINVASGDVNKLAVGDTFWAVVTLKDAAGLFSGGITLTWDSTKVQLSKANGDANTVTALVTEAASKITTTATTTGLNLETGEEDSALKAFEQNAFSSTATNLTYDFSAMNITTMEGEEGFWDYPLSGDTVIVKARFKVLAAENPNFTFTKTQLCEEKADGGVRNATGTVKPVGFAGAAPTTKTVGLVASLKYDPAKTGVAFTVKDTVANITSAPYQVSYAALAGTIEALADITVGLKVTDVPETSILTATAELY